MEPRMLDKINDLEALRKNRENCDRFIEDTITDIMAEIENIVVKAGIPGYMLVNLGNRINTQF